MENATYWAAQLARWMVDGPNAGLQGTYYVEIGAGQPILVLDGERFGQETVNHLKNSLIGHGFPDSTIRNRGDHWRLFLEPEDSRLKSPYDADWREFESHDDYADTEV